jgi:nitrite reductase/ring-hydroxylating ferredoxin subunit
MSGAADSPIPPATRDSLHHLGRRRFLGYSSGLFFAAAAAPHALAGAFKPLDLGSLTEFKKDEISTRFVRHNFFLIRNNGRLYATIATCPHKGNYLVRDVKDPARIVCTGHDAVFDAEGKPIEGRVKKGLARFAISVNPDGHVLVDTNKDFEQARWNSKASYIELPKQK